MPIGWMKATANSMRIGNVNNPVHIKSAFLNTTFTPVIGAYPWMSWV